MSDVKYLVTGATGFIGSQVYCRLVKAVGFENVVILARKKPDPESSLFARRLRLEGLHDRIDEAQFVLAPFSNPDLFREGLDSLVKTYGAKTKWRVVHMAAVISLATAHSAGEQQRINVGVTADLVNWANDHAENFVFTSSISSFGATVQPEVRSEKDFDDFPSVCRNFPYFTTKREAHQYVVEAARISASLVCPGIVHGALDSYKDSRKHLVLLREGKLRICPRGGGNFVGLDRVATHVVEEAMRPDPKPGEKRTILSVDRNLTYKEYFELYLHIYRGEGAPRMRLFPKLLDRALLAAHDAFSDKKYWPQALSRLPQASLFMYFKSEHPQPATKGLEEALRDSLSTLG